MVLDARTRAKPNGVRPSGFPANTTRASSARRDTSIRHLQSSCLMSSIAYLGVASRR